MNDGFWSGRRVLVTGHTGFKGAWLCLWLEALGARVYGLSLPPPTDPALASLLGPRPGLDETIGDIRDAAAVTRCIAAAIPEIVIHMAAQSLVRLSYVDPVETFATNLMGTVNLLQAARAVPSLKAVLVVTTDKVYENTGSGTAFQERDPLGAADPYSASKACAELAAASWRHGFLGERVATARAGNVIGGGDWARDRLVPDVVRAWRAGDPVALRYPEAVRPWQHVLEPLAGYIAMCRRMVETPESVPAALNFGPAPESFLKVGEVVEQFTDAFGGRPGWRREVGEHPPEAGHLTLSSCLAEASLGWRPRLDAAEAIAWTAEWYTSWRDGGDLRALTTAQIRRYQERLP